MYEATNDLGVIVMVTGDTTGILSSGFNRATKCDVIRPTAKPINRASGSKQLQYTAVSYDLHALSEAVEIQCSHIHPKYQYT